MISVFKVFVASLIVFFSTSICAQTRQLVRTKSEIKEAQQSFEQREADGLQVTIYQVSANGMVPVSPRKAFKSGDRFKLKLQSNFDGYVYVLNVTPVGENRLLFPRPSSRRNSVRAGESYDIPSQNDFEFKDEPGIETLRVLMSRDPVLVLDVALDRAPKKASYVALDSTTVRAVEELVGKPARSKTGGITAQASGRKPGIGVRMLKLDRKKQTTFVVVSGNNKVPSRFQPGEISVFEIRLTHL